MGLPAAIGHEMAHAASKNSTKRRFRFELTQTVLGDVQGSLSQGDPSQI